MGKSRAWLLYALAWVPIAILYAAALAQEIAFGRAVQGALTTVGVAALLGVGVWRLSGAIPWQPERAARFMAVHLLLALAFDALWLASIYGRLAFLGGWELARLVAAEEGGWTAVAGIWMYGLLVGGSHAIRAEQRVRQEREAAARAEALASRAEAERARMELHALRARIQPHFLFNTLHTIRALVGRDPGRAADGIEQLGELLRYIVDLEGRDTDLVSLREELAFTRAYVGLERTRLGERLVFEESVDPDALDARIPALTLQPLIENAIRHGIAPRARGGRIRLDVRERDGRLAIVVEDDGVGSEEGASEDAHGIGLRTVRKRIETRYDGAGSFAIRTRPGAGFRVDIGLPAEVRLSEGR